MRAFCKSRGLAGLMALIMLMSPLSCFSEDIDIFVGVPTQSNGNPNVLIVLDNTSNWARQSQQWPGGEQQGQSEVAAIKQAINSLNDKVNVGLMEFVTDGDANDIGGYVRYAVRPMTTANKGAFSGILDTIYAGINSPAEKRNSGTEYGNLIQDAYNYFAGVNQSQGGSGTPAASADSAGYTSNYGSFRSPLSCGTECAGAFIIFISNPNSSGPTRDSATNTTALSAAGGNTSQLGLPNQTTTTVNQSGVLGTTTQCHATQSACETNVDNTASADYSALNCASSSAGCACTTSVPNTSTTCPTGTFSYSVTGSSAKLGPTSACYQDQAGAPKNFPDNAETKVCASGTATFSNRQQGSCGNNRYTWDVTCTGSTASLGNSNTCYASTTACLAACPTNYTSCTCANPSSTAESCPTDQNRYTVTGLVPYTSVTPTGTYTTDTNPFNLDEWTRHLYQNGVPVPGCSRQPVTTYTMDVFNAQQNAQHTSLMLGAAKAGGGKYFAAKNKNDIVTYLNEIFREIQSINSTFASASLPISATNRAQNSNQVFFASFRPDPDTKPRWFGNVKQYKLKRNASGDIALADVNNNDAVNNNTGFISECAVSAWTTNSGNYWESYPVNPSFAESQCSDATKFNDLPDGARVEKGGVAQVLRNGNNPAVTTPTLAVNRTFYTESSGALVAFNTTNSGLSSTLVEWVKGADTENEDVDISLTETRASIHGDVIHSRPLPVNYCLTANCSNTVLYYGANDGTLRAVNAFTGQEKWSFVAPEHFGKFDRLRTQSPLVAFPNQPTPLPTPTPTARDYFFDGSIGIYQNIDNSNVWIYPTMRRGGRMLYAFNVTNADLPTLKWKFGCDAGNNCTSGASNIGQTWSIPNLAKIKDGTVKMHAVVGGGYDTCEDDNNASPACTSPKGNQVYILDADTGVPVKTFTTHRSMMGDVALIDMDKDKIIDYAIAADTGGNIYRIAFASYNSATGTFTPLTSNQWTITRIAYTTGEGRKFQFSPALFGAAGKIYIALGSGDRERPLITNYPYTTPVTNRFYMYRDCLPNGLIASSNITGGDNLDDTAKMNGYTATTPATCLSPITSNSNCDTNKGWFIDLNNGRGEQTVTPAVIAGGLVTFSTNRPLPAAPNTCSTGLGEARGYWLNLFSGSGAIGVSGDCGGVASDTFVAGGLPPPPVTGNPVIDGVSQSVIIGAVGRGGNKPNTIGNVDPTPGVATPTRKKMYFQIKGDTK